MKNEYKYFLGIVGESQSFKLYIVLLFVILYI